MAGEEEDFESQLEQEKVAKVEKEEKEAATRGLTYTDTDGAVMEWDPARRAYFPQIDTDFIARYQMNYGMEASEQSGKDNSDTSSTANANSTVASVADNAKAWEDYYNQYNSQTAKDTSDAKAEGSESDQKNYSDADWYQYYHYYYGEDYALKWWNTRQEEKEEAEEAEKEKKEAEEKQAEGDGKDGKKKGKGKEAEKRKAPDEPPSWFEVEEEKSTHVYVSGLPDEMTDEDFMELMSKYGLIMFDPINRKPKLKLYKNPDGSVKGDGLCCFIKQESVDLVLNLLDGSNVGGKTVSVERAKFTLKGEFDPTKKKKKLSNKAKRKLKEKQAKLFDWTPDLPAETGRLKFERIVVLKNMFEVKEFDTDPALINELREDVRGECSKFGDVRKVTVHDRHAEGVISVAFRTPEEGDACIAALNGRWFGGKRISAATYDGKTKYDVHETEAEKEERLQGWEKFLVEGDDPKSDASGSKGAENSGKKAPAERGSEGVQRSGTEAARERTAGGPVDASVEDSSDAGASSGVPDCGDTHADNRGRGDMSANSALDSEGGGASN